MWNRTINWPTSAALGHLCGWGKYSDHILPLTLDLPNHVGTSLTLRVTTNLDSDATDESWGIANVKVGPLHSRWHGTELFAAGVTHGWEGTGTAATAQDCSLAGTVLGGPANAISGTSLKKSRWRYEQIETRALTCFCSLCSLL